MRTCDSEHVDKSAEPRRVFVYCHDGVGIGHLSRTLTICERIGKRFPASTFLLATGTPYIPLFRSVPRVDYIKLPSLQKVDNRTYEGKYLAMPPKQLMRCRESLLQNTVKHFEPDLVLIDKAPLGVCRELAPTLYWLRANRPQTRVVFGMRDIEDSAEETIEQWKKSGVSKVLEDCYDAIWVYGMQDLFDPAVEYKLSTPIRGKLSYIGYVTQGSCDHAPTTPGRKDKAKHSVLVTVGGGTDGERLLRAYLEGAAARVKKMGFSSTMIGGPDLPAEAAASLQATAARLGVEWVDFESCMDCRIRRSRLVVSMGGYNTLCQIARNRKPALVLPRIKPRLEQLVRARLWSQRGAVDMIDPAALTPAYLGDRVVEMLERDVDTTTHDLDLKGLDRVCECFEACWNREEHDAASLCM